MRMRGQPDCAPTEDDHKREATRSEMDKLGVSLLQQCILLATNGKVGLFIICEEHLQEEQQSCLVFSMRKPKSNLLISQTGAPVAGKNHKKHNGLVPSPQPGYALLWDGAQCLN